jgi:hypothetical protein
MTKPKNPYIYIEVDINNEQEVIDLFKNNTSGTLAKPNYLQKQYPELYNNIIEWSERFNLELIFSQKIYHYIHRMEKQPLCRTCNKVVPNFMSVNIGYKDYCCNSCAKLHPDTKAKLDNTLLNKYGTTDVLNSKENIEKKKQSMLERYGVDNYSKTEEFKQKQISYNQEKYGVDYTFQLDSVKEKIKETNFEKRGVTHHSKTDVFKSNLQFNTTEAQNKAKKTLLERYGVDNPMKSSLIVQRAQNTNKEKYGVSSPSQNLDILNKMKSTTFSIYGTDNYAKTDMFKEQHAQHAMKNHMDFYDYINIQYKIESNKIIHNCNTKTKIRRR